MIIPLEHLKKHYNFNPKGVLHVGASEGQEAGEYYQSGIDKMIFIEAIPEVFLKLKSNISKYPNATALNACISDQDGKEVVFNVSNNEGQSSSILPLGTHKEAHPEVSYIGQIPMKTVTLETLLKDIDVHGIDFLNIDLQGAELLALRGMGPLLSQIKWAYLEVNEKELYEGCALLPDVDLFMIGQGFVRVETRIFRQWGWGDAFYIKRYLHLDR